MMNVGVVISSSPPQAIAHVDEIVTLEHSGFAVQDAASELHMEEANKMKPACKGEVREQIDLMT